ncbi:MAG: hypothetical protein ACK5DD_06595 [Cyclobacteriaceae bacterium]|jgi:hypothetical protein
MKKIVSPILICFSCFAGVFAQESFENKPYGFAMPKPDKWIEANNKELLANLDRFDLKEEELTKIINDHKGSILLTSFYKYNPKNHAGLIPTIQINVRTNATQSFDEFVSVMTRSANSFKQYFPDFSFEVEPSIVEVGGVRSIFFVGKFSMQGQTGGAIKVRSRTYAIPYGSYFFQLNFTDGQDTEDSSELFDQLIQTVRIGK